MGAHLIQISTDIHIAAAKLLGGSEAELEEPVHQLTPSLRKEDFHFRMHPLHLVQLRC